MCRKFGVRWQADSKDWKPTPVRLPICLRRSAPMALTKDEIKNCVWLKPELVAQIGFTEWTPDGHLRHSRFVGLREDKAAREVVREN